VFLDTGFRRYDAFDFAPEKTTRNQAGGFQREVAECRLALSGFVDNSQRFAGLALSAS
jgi:hypothetical protein